MEDNLKKAIEQMKNGEEKGFNAVYSATYNRVYFKAKQIMKKEEDAQDLTQIVFIEAYKNIHTLQATEALYSWLDGITYNQGMKIYRKQRDVLLTEEAEGMFDTIESNDISSIPELSSDQKATADIIRGIIEELPELQKSAVIAYYYDGFKVEQIADMMECSVNTIKSRLNYARKYIKDRVEEKEKKEGYRLHAFGLPVLWFSIRMLAEETKLTAHAAQNVYNGACSSVGLQSTAISMAGGTATGTVSGAATIAGEATKAAGLGAKFASLSTSVKALIIAGTVAVAGLGTAGMVSIMNNQPEEVVEESVEESITTDVNIENLILIEEDLSKAMPLCRFIENGAEPVLYPTRISENEYLYSAEDLQSVFQQGEKISYQGFIPNTVVYKSFVAGNYETGKVEEMVELLNAGNNGFLPFYVDTSHDITIIISKINETVDIKSDNNLLMDRWGNEIFAEENISEQEAEQQAFELTDSAQRQISAFVAAAYQYNYSSVNNGNGWNFSSMTPDECLFFVNDYIGMINYTWNGGASSNAADLPYDWYNYKVTEQEFADFFKYGLGIEIPSDYTYSFENEGGSIKISNGELQSTFDGRTLQITGGNVEIVSQDENGIVLSGTCYWYDPEETEYQFTITGVPSGNSDIFCGMTITDIEISEADTEVVQSNKTLADIDLSGFIKMQSDNSYMELAGGYFTHTDVPLYIRTTPMGLLEGYWTLDGQELYFIGDDASNATVQDLEGNTLNIHIGLYTMGDINSSDGCMYIYTTETEFRSYPNYVYIR